MRLVNRYPGRLRTGFTLVEMLIALALSIFIMAILSEAFVTGLKAFSQLKALGDLEERLRTVANIIRRDLRAAHFENSKKLSECTVTGKPMPMLDGLRAGTYSVGEAIMLNQQLAQYQLKSPAQGFFSIEEWANRPGVAGNRTTSFFEGQDSASSRTSYRDQYDVLHFTSRLEGNEPDKFFYGKVRLGSPLDGIGRSSGLTRYDSGGNQLFSSQAAELLYFIGNDDTANIPGVGVQGGPVQTFNLYRQAWLLVPGQYSNGQPYDTNPALPAGTPSSQPLFDSVIANYFNNNDVSAVQDNTVNGNPAMFFNTMADVQHRARRHGVNPVNPLLPLSSNNPVPVIRSPKINTVTGGLDGSDIMLTNVISFDVKVYDPFAYKIPLRATNGGPASGRGAYVDIGDVYDNIPGTTTVGNPGYPQYPPTAASDPNDFLTPVFGTTINPGSPPLDTFDTGTSRLEGVPNGTVLGPTQSPATHRYPITSIQITIRVFEPKSQQTRQITIIQDM